MYTLYAYTTPNARKVSILLEELQVPYQVQKIDLRAGEQYKPEFLKINPNNKIPALVDKENDFCIFESLAIMMYLAEKHERFLPSTDLVSRTKALQWCALQATGISPVFSQLYRFTKLVTEPVPTIIDIQQKESLRLLSVLNQQLSSHTYLTGDRYTIADMSAWPWIAYYQQMCEQKIDKKKFCHVMRWFDAIGEREAVKRGMQVPA